VHSKLISGFLRVIRRVAESSAILTFCWMADSAVAFGLASSASSRRAMAADLPTHRVLTLDAARQVIAAAEAEAQRQGWPCVIAVVDDGGHLIALERMDASPMLASVELAPAKARTAALFRKPTKALEDAIRAGRVALATAGFVEMEGGVPLTVKGEVVGAIGASSAQPDWDSRIAAAGAAALSARP
jgi:glc operon protein GlcG